MNAAEVMEALRIHYGSRRGPVGWPGEWAVLDEVGIWSGGRIDALAIRMWRSGKGHQRHAIEVKVDRSDLRREIETGKWKPWARITHRFYLAVPHDMNIDGIELPETWGVLRCHPERVRRQRWATLNAEAGPLPEDIGLVGFRRAAVAEHRMRTAGDPSTELAAVKDELRRAENRIQTARTAELRWQDRYLTAMETFAAAYPDVKCQCGTTIKCSKRPSHFGLDWKHEGEPGMVEAYNGRVPCHYPRVDFETLTAR